MDKQTISFIFAVVGGFLIGSIPVALGVICIVLAVKIYPSYVE